MNFVGGQVFLLLLDVIGFLGRSRDGAEKQNQNQNQNQKQKLGYFLSFLNDQLMYAHGSLSGMRRERPVHLVIHSREGNPKIGTRSHWNPLVRRMVPPLLAFMEVQPGPFPQHLSGAITTLARVSISPFGRGYSVISILRAQYVPPNSIIENEALFVRLAYRDNEGYNTWNAACIPRYHHLHSLVPCPGSENAWA